VKPLIEEAKKRKESKTNKHGWWPSPGYSRKAAREKRRSIDLNQ